MQSQRTRKVLSKKAIQIRLGSSGRELGKQLRSQEPLLYRQGNQSSEPSTHGKAGRGPAHSCHCRIKIAQACWLTTYPTKPELLGYQETMPQRNMVEIYPWRTGNTLLCLPSARVCTHSDTHGHTHTHREIKQKKVVWGSQAQRAEDAL